MWSSSGSKKVKINKPHRLMCLSCKTIACSVYYGYYSSCDCGAVAIDETEEWIRILGNKSDFCEVDYEPDTWDKD